MSLTLESTKSILLILIFLFLKLFEQFRPYKLTHNNLRHDANNLGLLVVNVAITILLFTFLFAWISNYTVKHQLGLLNLFSISYPLKVVFAVILIDCWQYWWHRMNHRLPFLWRFHRVHHVDDALNTSSAFRFHFMEIFFSNCLRLLLIPVFGLDLFSFIVYELISLPIIMFHHSNLNVPTKIDNYLNRLIVTPGMHWIHHSVQPNETDSNYASIFSIWDKIFLSRTFQAKDNLQLGLKQYPKKSWDSLPKSLLFPFK